MKLLGALLYVVLCIGSLFAVPFGMVVAGSGHAVLGTSLVLSGLAGYGLAEGLGKLWDRRKRREEEACRS